MSPIEQAAYFWSYVLVENKNNEFDVVTLEGGLEINAADLGITAKTPKISYMGLECSQPHDDSLFLERVKEVIPNWKDAIVQKQKAGTAKKGR